MTAPNATLMIGYLGPGGAERQIGYLASGLVEAGWKVAILAFSLNDDGAHFAQSLVARDIPLHALDQPDPLFRAPGLLLRLGLAAPLLHSLPDEIRTEVVKALAFFMNTRPELVVCYLDRVNIVGGLAAMLAGVPRILVSGRNLNPTHMPYLDRPWFRDLYRFLLASPAVTLMANSHAGARSYEHWLGLAHACVPVIHNGLAEDALPPPMPDQVAAVRAELGLDALAPLVLGVFRLSPEKRPAVFFGLIERLRRDFPDLHAIVAGTGIAFDDMRQSLSASGQDSFIHLLGRRSDMPALFQAADLMLHVSEAEGVPNAVMEAQWLGCPVVGTLGGGTAEILTRVQQPYFHPLDAIDAVHASCVALLADPARRRHLGEAARDEARGRFSLRLLVEHTLALARRPMPPALSPIRRGRFGPAAMAATLRLWLQIQQPRRRLRRLRHLLRKPYQGCVTDIGHDQDRCYLAPVPAYLTSDETGRSHLRLFEDGHSLGPPHVAHTEIRAQGNGRYSHWGQWLYFSASDDTDPRANGRVYTMTEVLDDDD